MKDCIKIGNFGEKLAYNWLCTQKFTILEQNYRFLNYEVDIIAQKGQFIHFIEVKTRSSVNFGQPESFVNKNKLERIKTIAVKYIEEHPCLQQYWPQYDIIAITLYSKSSHKIDYIADIF